MIVGCFAVIAAGTLAVAPQAGASSSSVTAPAQLTRAYPLGPQRLCCAGTGAARPAAGSPSRQPRSAARSADSTQPTGSSAVIWIVAGAGAALIMSAGAGVRYSRGRRLGHAIAHPAPTLADEPGPDLAAERGDPTGAFNLGVLLHQRHDFAGAIAAYERSEQRGDPDAAFNLGVLLYEAGDLDRAEAAWRRAIQRGNVQAAANLGFLLHRRGDLEGARLAYLTAQRQPATQAAPTRSEQPGPPPQATPADATPTHGSAPRLQPRPITESAELAYRLADELGDPTGAFNLGVLLHQRHDFAGAIAAYERSEQRGDPDAAFNLGVLLYETGDLDRAQDAWRRGMRRGHQRAAANLAYLLESRGETQAPPQAPNFPQRPETSPTRIGYDRTRPA